MKKIKGTNGKLHGGRGAVDILEEAVYILSRFPETLFIYYIGGLPFVLGFLYFWADMGQGTYGGPHVLGAALSITLLFIWMKFCHVLFAKSVYQRVSEHLSPRPGLKEYFSILSFQTMVHCTVFFVWPIALLLTLPFGWVFAFYHYSSIAQEGADSTKMTWDRSWACTNHWPKQNHVLILLFMLLYTVTFINIGAVLFLIPQLLKNFFAIDSVFASSGVHFFNTTFLAVAFALTYLLVNPVIKTAYVIRYFEGNSAQLGNDIKADLRFLRSQKHAVLMALIIIFSTTTDLWAGEAGQAAGERTYPSFTTGSLNSSIDRVLSGREFAWRMPRALDAEGVQKAPSNSFLEWLYVQAAKIRPALGKLFRKCWKWWKKHFLHDESSGPSRSKWQPLKIGKALYILIFLMTVVLGGVSIAVWKMRKKKDIGKEKSAGSIPDIASDRIKADDLLVDEWLNMANSFLSQGDLRHAVRAFYLGTLSHLARSQIITIKQYKSNYDYEVEIKRHARGKEQLCGTFSQTVIFLNSVWYGNRGLEAQEVLEFARQQEKIVQLANA